MNERMISIRMKEMGSRDPEEEEDGLRRCLPPGITDPEYYRGTSKAGQ